MSIYKIFTVEDETQCVLAVIHPDKTEDNLTIGNYKIVDKSYTPTNKVVGKDYNVEYTDLDYKRARTIITTLFDENLLKSHLGVLDKEYLHLWNTMLELQNKLKDI